MPISSINKDTCIGCGECVKSCPMDVIRLDKKSNKASILFQEDCQSCKLCSNFCPVEGTITHTMVKCLQPMVGWG